MGGKIQAMATVLAAAVVALAATIFPGCSSSVHQTQTACARAKVGGHVVCLRPQERCQSRYERIYRSYGLTCKAGALRERSYIGPANP
jgi:hypothetical protein